MCGWMGPHFHNWIGYNGLTFLVELLEWGRTFSGFLVNCAFHLGEFGVVDRPSYSEND